MAQLAANKLHCDAAIWLFNFLIDRITPKDTSVHTSLQHLLKQVPIGHFYTAWYKLFYECHPRIYSMFDTSKADFHKVIFPPDKDLHWLEEEINTKRFNHSQIHNNEDVGEEECRKAVLFSIAGAKGFENAPK